MEIQSSSCQIRFDKLAPAVKQHAKLETLKKWRMSAFGKSAHFWKRHISICRKAPPACGAITVVRPAHLQSARALWVSSRQGNVCGSVAWLQSGRWTRARRLAGATCLSVFTELIHLPRLLCAVCSWPWAHMLCSHPRWLLWCMSLMHGARVAAGRACRQWQRSGMLGNGVCTTGECITLTDANPQRTPWRGKCSFSLIATLWEGLR